MPADAAPAALIVHVGHGSALGHDAECVDYVIDVETDNLAAEGLHGAALDENVERGRVAQLAARDADWADQLEAANENARDERARVAELLSELDELREQLDRAVDGLNDAQRVLNGAYGALAQGEEGYADELLHAALSNGGPTRFAPRPAG